MAVLGIPVDSGTRIEVSIPKRAVMGLVAEGFEIEAAFAAAQLTVQRREACPVDVSRAQDETLRSFLELDPVAGLHTQCLRDASGKSDLTLGANLEEHGGDLLFVHLTRTGYRRGGRVKPRTDRALAVPDGDPGLDHRPTLPFHNIGLPDTQAESGAPSHRRVNFDNSHQSLSEVGADAQETSVTLPRPSILCAGLPGIRAQSPLRFPNSSVRAAELIATTAGCVKRRSTDMA